MEIRRALLLFAIVLGLAAIASSIARPPDRPASDSEAPPPSAPTPSKDGGTAPEATSGPAGTAGSTRVIRFREAGKPRMRVLDRNRPGTVFAEVGTAGQVEIPSLGLTQPAEPLTPARFDVLVSRPGKHPIVFTPAVSDRDAADIGTLKVVEPR